MPITPSQPLVNRIVSAFTIDNHIFYVAEVNAHGIPSWTTWADKSKLLNSEAALEILALVQGDTAFGPPNVVVKTYAILDVVNVVPQYTIVASHDVPPTIIARRAAYELVQPLALAVRLAESAGKLPLLTAAIAEGSSQPLTVDELYAFLSP